MDRNTRTLIVVLVALAAAGVATYGVARVVWSRPVVEREVAHTYVVAAARTLPIGSMVTAADVKLIAWPERTGVPGAFTKVEDVVSRGLVAQVLENEPLTQSKLAPVGSGAGLPPTIPPGMRALSVRVNDVVGVAGYVLPGTHVDVLVTINPTNQPTDVTSKLVLTNVLVLASGTKIEQSENNKPIQVTVVTLMVAPDEAEKLTLASTEGKILLALRNPLDKTAPPTPSIKPAPLVGSGMAPVRVASGRVVSRPAPVAPAPAPAPTVEIIRGDKRSQEVVAQE